MDGHIAEVNYELACSSFNELTQPSHDLLNFQDGTAASYLQMPSSIPAKDQQPTQSFHINDMVSALIPPGEQCSGKNMNYSRQAIEILGSVHALHPSQVCSDDHLNQDILIRAILEGWHTLQNKNDDPLWGIIRKMDASINIRSGPTTRLAMLRGIHQFLLVGISSPLGNEI